MPPGLPAPLPPGLPAPLPPGLELLPPGLPAPLPPGLPAPLPPGLPAPLPPGLPAPLPTGFEKLFLDLLSELRLFPEKAGFLPLGFLDLESPPPPEGFSVGLKVS